MSFFLRKDEAEGVDKAYQEEMGKLKERLAKLEKELIEARAKAAGRAVSPIRGFLEVRLDDFK